ncbi:MAG: prepilin-type N-terminal cleavage/methylation domain-containing protein [Deltaproteobacteria bacterium]
MTNNSGFTLIEFMVAILILMVGLLGMLQGINLAMDKNLENTIRNEGALLADEMMMAKRNKTFAALSTTTTNNVVNRYNRGVYKNYSVQQVVNMTTSNTKEIIINVSWKHRNQRKTQSVSSFVSTISP